MTNSDIIAIVAIVASLITSIVTVVFGYLTHRSTIRAERSKIAFEKRIDALRDIYDKMSMLNNVYETFYIIVEDIIVSSEHYKTSRSEFIMGNDYLRKGINAFPKNRSFAKTNFMTTYYRNRVYIPPNIDKLLKVYESKMIRRGEPIVWFQSTLEEIEDTKRTMNVCTENVVRAMHQFIGFE